MPKLGITIHYSASGISLSGPLGTVDLTPLTKRQLSDVAHLVNEAREGVAKGSR